jgi:hypothetical protein
VTVHSVQHDETMPVTELRAYISSVNSTPDAVTEISQPPLDMEGLLRGATFFSGPVGFAKALFRRQTGLFADC